MLISEPTIRIEYQIPIYFISMAGAGLTLSLTLNLCEEFKKSRPEDLTLNIALSDHNETLKYSCFAHSGPNGFFSDDAVAAKVNEGIVYLGSIEVPAMDVREFLTTYVGDRNIDFLNMDIRGIRIESVKKLGLAIVPS